MTDIETAPMSVVRETNADRLNEVVNHPYVRPWVGGGSDALDLSDIVSNPNNLLLMAEGGGLLFVKTDIGIYEVHTQFVPEHRGEKALQAVKDALRFVFTRTDCIEVQTKVPDGNRAALALVKAIGGEFLFYRPEAWPTDAGPVGVKHYTQTIHSWAGKSEASAVAGHCFHEALEAAKVAMGAANPLHPDDDAHDRYVGATTEMMLAGQIDKGLWFYNRWARLSGYAEVAQIAANPPVIDIQDAILAVRPNGMEVLLCR